MNAITNSPEYTIDEQAWADEFVDLFKQTVGNFVQHICDYYADEMFPDKLVNQTAQLSLKARAWHKDVRSNVLTLDFQPCLYDANGVYDAETMKLFEDHKPNPSHHGPILTSVGFGLTSSESFGTKKPSVTVWQVKVDVIVEGYFDD